MTDPSPTRIEDEPGFASTLRDGSMPEAELAASVRGRRVGPVRMGPGSVRWVRPVDAVAELGSATAGRGIDLHRELARRLLEAPASIQPVLTERLHAVCPAVRAAIPPVAGELLGRARR